MAFRFDPEIKDKSFTEFLDKRSALAVVTNLAVFVLVLISNIYNTTPNKLMVISYFLERKQINKLKLKNSMHKLASDDSSTQTSTILNFSGKSSGKSSFESGADSGDSASPSEAPLPGDAKGLKKMQTRGGANGRLPGHRLQAELLLDAGAAAGRAGAGGGVHRAQGGSES